MFFQFAGIVVLTICAFFVIIRRKKKIQLKKIQFRQSVIFSVIKDILPSNQELKRKNKAKTQSLKHTEESTVKVIVTPDNKCYWVLNNAFYCAEVIDGKVDPETAKTIETDKLSKQEINELLAILDTLRSE